MGQALMAVLIGFPTAVIKITYLFGPLVSWRHYLIDSIWNDGMISLSHFIFFGKPDLKFLFIQSLNKYLLNV